MKIICVYPIEEDKSTDFLLPIYEMFKSLDTDQFVGYRPQKGDEVDMILDDLLLEEEQLFIFLGHGSSTDIRNNHEAIINDDNFSLLKNKKVFLLSCRSEEFISRNNSVPLKEYIGFGNMITSWDEILAERNFDLNAYINVTEEHIDDFNKILANSILNSLSKAILKEESSYYLYSKIKIYLNKAIVELLLEKKVKGYRVLADLLFKLKKEIIWG